MIPPVKKKKIILNWPWLLIAQIGTQASTSDKPINISINDTILQSLSKLIFFIACKNKFYVHITPDTSEID